MTKFQSELIAFIKSRRDSPNRKEQIDPNDKLAIKFDGIYPVIPELNDIAGIKKTAIESLLRSFLNHHYRELSKWPISQVNGDNLF